jgi:alkylation response protein AidB-like acyl-CoA dehydrogenase
MSLLRRRDIFPQKQQEASDKTGTRQSDQMKERFPTEREAKRQVLLQAVDNVRGILAANAEEAETERTLPQATVAALRESGLFLLKTPALLGGAEADPMMAFQVIEAVSYIDSSAGWCLGISAAGLGLTAALLPDSAIAEIFAVGPVPTVAGALMPGQAAAVDGGYRVSGCWSWASGIRHADWVTATVRIDRDKAPPPELRMLIVPAAQVEILDNWHVAGMKGTGSFDFALADVFVPEAFSYDLAAQPRRGGPLYRLGIPGFFVYEHAAFALGVARRALDTIIELAQTKARGYGKTVLLASRAVFQQAVAEGDLRLRAARALIFEVMEKAWTTVCAGDSLDSGLQAELRSATTLVNDIALDVTTTAFRYGAGSAVLLDNVLQRCLRDLQVESSHLMVNDSAYENYGQVLLGVPDVDPMK